MSRYPLAAKQAEFASAVLDCVGKRGWVDTVSKKLWPRFLEEFGDKADTTRKLYISKFRAFTRAAFEALDDADPRKKQTDAAVGLISFPEGLNEAVYADYQAKIHNRVSDLVTVGDYRAFVTLFHEQLAHTDVRVKALAVMMLTGRRFYEVLTKGDFSPIEAGGEHGVVRSKYSLMFVGQAKTRGAIGTQDGKSFPIPCLAPASEILAAVEAIRQSDEGKVWRDLGSRELNEAESGRMNQMLKGFMAPHQADEPDLVENFTIKNMRALYAEIAYEVFAPKKLAKSAYFARILGHADTDLKTALSYMRYVLGHEKKAIKAAQDEIQRLSDAHAAAMAEYQAKYRAERREKAAETVPSDDDVIENK